MKDFNNAIIPVIKVEDYVEMDDSTFEVIKRDLVQMEHIVRTFSIVGIITALILGGLVALFCFYKVSLIHSKSINDQLLQSGRFHRRYAVSAQEATKSNHNTNGRTVT